MEAIHEIGRICLSFIEEAPPPHTNDLHTNRLKDLRNEIFAEFDTGVYFISPEINGKIDRLLGKLLEMTMDAMKHQTAEKAKELAIIQLDDILSGLIECRDLAVDSFHNLPPYHNE